MARRAPAERPGTREAAPIPDKNGRPDCQETLVQNPDFDTGPQSWPPDANVTQRWEATPDGRNDPGSGSIVVTNTSSAMSALGTGQCARVGANKTYGVLAQMFIRSGQGALRGGGIHVRYFQSEDCTSGPTAGPMPFIDQGMDAWRLVEYLVVTPIARVP